jgi:nitric oxide reductase NorD protein
MLSRAAGAAPAARLATASAVPVGGPRTWLQRLAGAGTHAAIARWEAEVIALPPAVSVFADATLNRRLYLWLAALAAYYEPRGDWIADNLRATRRALGALPGLKELHDQLIEAELARRAAPTTPAERLVRAALHGVAPNAACDVRPIDVAPVWSWLDIGAPSPATPARDTPPEADVNVSRPAPGGRQRRHAQQVTDTRSEAPLMMFFRAESLLSWGEFVHVDRASDDEDDGQARSVADDMDTLAIAPGGERLASRVRFDLDLPSAAADDRPLGPGLRLPEWDWRRQALIPDHCCAQLVVAAAAQAFAPTPALRATAAGVRRRMQALRAAPRRAHAQADGDELDVDAWVRWRTDVGDGAPRSESPAVWRRSVRSDRSLATLLLADLSLSTDAYCSDTQRVIDVVRDALYVFGEALAAGGDAFEMLGFSSVRRQHVRLQLLKSFGEAWHGAPVDRVGAIKPGYYTRMGAAIRLATGRLVQRPERQKLLLILTDGKPNDLDLYEGRYGLEDTRHAVREARAAGLVPFCVTIDAQAHDYLPQLFGRRGWALVHRPRQLVQRLAVIHAALTRGD